MQATLLKQGVNESAANFNLTHYSILRAVAAAIIEP